MLPAVITLSVLLVIILGIFYFRNKQHTPDANLLAQVRERAEQRKVDRAFANTTPAEDPYERAYDLSLAMSSTEVDESANGYGMLDEEQKRVIAAIFDGQSQVPSSFTTEANGIVNGSRWSQSVFGELNRVDPIPERDIWATSRN